MGDYRLDPLCLFFRAVQSPFCKMKKLIQPILLLCFCFTFFSMANLGDYCLVQSQPKSNQPVKEQANPEEKSSRVPLHDYREILEKERKLLAEQAEQQSARVNNLFDRMIWMVTIIATFAFALLGWLFGTTRKEAKEFAREQLSGAIASTKSELNETRARLQEEVALFTGYKTRKIAWILNEGKPSIEKERGALEKFGLQNLEVFSTRIGDVVDVSSFELIILSYDDGAEDRRLLEEIVKAIKQKSPAVWLIIYTYNPNGAPAQIHREVLQSEVVKDFYWYVPAQFPATLVSQTLSLARFFGAKIL